MAYQRYNNKPSFSRGRQASSTASQGNAKQEWVTLGVGWNRPSGSKLAMNTILNIGGVGLKVRAFWNDKSKSQSKNPADLVFTIPKEEIPDNLLDLLQAEPEGAEQAG